MSVALNCSALSSPLLIKPTPHAACYILSNQYFCVSSLLQQITLKMYHSAFNPVIVGTVPALIPQMCQVTFRSIRRQFYSLYTFSQVPVRVCEENRNIESLPSIIFSLFKTQRSMCFHIQGEKGNHVLSLGYHVFWFQTNLSLIYIILLAVKLWVSYLNFLSVASFEK